MASSPLSHFGAVESVSARLLEKSAKQPSDLEQKNQAANGERDKSCKLNDAKVQSVSYWLDGMFNWRSMCYKAFIKPRAMYIDCQPQLCLSKNNNFRVVWVLLDTASKTNLLGSSLAHDFVCLDIECS